MNRSVIQIIQRLVLIFLLGQATILTAQQDAFPGAEGFGRYAKGGRGGDVYHVTNLNIDGSGSLRNGISSANGPRTIVFDISGNIEIPDGLKIDKPNITIAGQTAPGDGITLTDGDLSVSANDIIVRYIRCRLGDQSGADDDAIHISSGSNIIFDHVSTSWSVDETFSFQSADIDLLTVQWCMVTESLRDSHHEKGKHGYGGIIGGLRQTLHHNLYAHHSSRSPKVSGRRHCEVDFRNNVIYNWKYNNCYDGTKSYLNWANNYYKSGPGTDEGVRDRIFKLHDGPIDSDNEGSEISNTYVTSLYAEGNYVDGFPDITADNWNGGIDFNDGANEAENRVNTPHPFPKITKQTAKEIYPLVVAYAGASIVRDTIDKRIAHEVLTGTTTYNGSKTGTPGIIDSQYDVGGWPVLNSLPAPTDIDQDGMPDAWEIEMGLDSDNPEDRNDDRNDDGYTNLEEYLYCLIDANYIPSVSIHTPKANSGYLQTDTVFINAKASDFGEGSIESINLYLDSDLIRDFNASEIDTFLTNIALGEHSISVKATDNSGNSVEDSRKIYVGSDYYAIDITTVGVGSINMDPAGDSILAGLSVSLFARPDPRYTFNSWSGDIESTENPLALALTADISLTANFTLIPVFYNLYVNNGSGSGDYPEGEIVTITADTAPINQEFDIWKGDTSFVADVDTAFTSITMPSLNIIISASYKDIVTIKTKEHSTRFNCYPNPTSSSFSIDLSEIGTSTIEVFDTLGQSVYSVNSKEAIHTINDHKLESGIFLVRVVDPQGNRYTQKLVIK